MADKLFLTDVDGVLVSFSLTFEKYVKHHGLKTKTESLYDLAHYVRIEDWIIDESVTDVQKFVDEFFESEYAKHFIPFQDSIEPVKKLSNRGWKFIAITAIGKNSEIARSNRQLCLDNIYGKYVFSDVITVDPFETKSLVLKQFSPTFWVDDHVPHVESGLEAGHISFHMKRNPKQPKCNAPESVEVDSWNDIYDYINENF